MWFTLVVDDLGIKYIGKEHAEHLLNFVKENYDMETDWTGSLYVGITLKWNYHEGYVDISMPKYVQKTSPSTSTRNPSAHSTVPTSLHPENMERKRLKK